MLQMNRGCARFFAAGLQRLKRNALLWQWRLYFLQGFHEALTFLHGLAPDIDAAVCSIWMNTPVAYIRVTLDLCPLAFFRHAVAVCFTGQGGGGTWLRSQGTNVHSFKVQIRQLHRIRSRPPFAGRN